MRGRNPYLTDTDERRPTQRFKITFLPEGRTIEVDPETRVVLLVPGDRSLLKPGAAVSVFTQKDPDGQLTARAVQAEKNGVKPLM